MNLSSKLETKPTADHAGLSELLKPCLTEFALLLKENCKPEFLLKIWFLAVTNAEMDATEVTPMLLGNTGPLLVLLPETCTTLPTGANPTLYPPATTTLSELLNHALPVLTPLLVKEPAEKDGTLNTTMTKLTDKLLSDLETMLPKFRLN